MEIRFQRIFIVLFFLTSSIYSFGQEAKTIEIVATDTIELRPLEFIYQVSAGEQYNLSAFVASQKGKDTIPSTTTDEIRTLLEKNKFIFEESQEFGYT